MSRLEKARSHFESILASSGDFLSQEDSLGIHPAMDAETGDGVPRMASREKLIIAQRGRDQHQHTEMRHQESRKQQRIS